MPSRRRSATDPTEPADSATTDVTGADHGNVAGPVAEGTATRSPNPLAGKRAYRVKQAIHVDGARVRPGEIVMLNATSGVARSPFVTLIEDDADVPPEVAAAFDEAG